MAGHSHMTTGYSNYNDLPPQEGGYIYGQGQNVNWYVVETTTVEHVRVPSDGYTSYDGAPFKEYMPKYAPMDHHGGYELDYGSNYEISSPHGYFEQENLMNDFLNKIQIGASRPMKPRNLSGPNRYRPTSPNKYRPTSPNKYRLTSPNKYRPKSPTHGYPSRDGYPIRGQNLQGQTKYQPMGPITYRPTSPAHNYPSKDAHINNPQNMPELNRYHPTSPNYRPMSPTKYRTTSPNKYHPTSPNKYQTTNPIEYRQKSPTKYQPTSPTHSYPSKEDNPIKGQKLSGQNNYRPTSAVLKFPSKEIQPIRTQSFSSPNKQHPSSPDSEGSQHARLGDFSSPNTPKTKHHLTSPTNNIDEAFDHLAQPMNNLLRSEPKRDGVFNNLFSHAQPTEPEGRYAKRILGRAINKGFFRSNTIDSEEAVKKYNGANVP